jgi:hypothetical protein
LTSVPVVFSMPPMRTHADQLRFAIAFALLKASKVVRGLRRGLTEDERYAVADAVVWRLQDHGDPWQLSEELPNVTARNAPTTPENSR